MKIQSNVIIEDVEFLSNKFLLDKIKNQKILITGCNGLIGNYLLQFFAFNSSKYNLEVYGTSFSEILNIERYSSTILESFKYFSWDASNHFPEEEKRDYDLVFFCSGYAQPSKFIANPVKTALIHIVGISSILSILKKDAVFVNMSSSEVYGNPEVIPTPETYLGKNDPSNLRASYIYSKLIGEVVCNSYSKNLTVKNCRISLTYGPGTEYNDERVLQQIILKGVNGNGITLIDDGSALRTYCYIRDTIEMILNITFSSKQSVYNVANPLGTISIYDLANEIAKHFKCNVTKTINSSAIVSQSAPKAVVMNIDRYLEEFEAPEFITIEHGLNKIYKYFNI
jgi:UDP-glucuronate decarboxylase